MFFIYSDGACYGFLRATTAKTLESGPEQQRLKHGEGSMKAKAE